MGSRVVFLFPLHPTSPHNFVSPFVLCALCPYNLTLASGPLRCAPAVRFIEYFCYQNSSSWWSSLLTITVLAGHPVLSCSVQDFFKLPWKLVIMFCCNKEVEDNQIAYLFLFTFPSLHQTSIWACFLYLDSLLSITNYLHRLVWLRYFILSGKNL